MTIMTKEELIALQERQKQVEEELAWIKRQVTTATSEAADYYSVKEATTTTSSCDSAAVPSRKQHQHPKQACRPVPYGSTEEASPLLEHRKMQTITDGSSCKDTEESPPPDHIMLFGTAGDHHEWEECFSHVRSEEDLENEKIHNESVFYLHSSMFARGTCLRHAHSAQCLFF